MNHNTFIYLPTIDYRKLQESENIRILNIIKECVGKCLPEFSTWDNSIEGEYIVDKIKEMDAFLRSNIVHDKDLGIIPTFRKPSTTLKDGKATPLDIAIFMATYLTYLEIPFDYQVDNINETNSYLYLIAFTYPATIINTDFSVPVDTYWYDHLNCENSIEGIRMEGYRNPK